MPTGPQLRKIRRAAEVSTVALSLQMEVSRTTLWVIERSVVVEPRTAEKYRASVDAIVTARAAETAA